MLTQLLYLLVTAARLVSGAQVLEMHSFTQETSLATFTSRWANFGTSVPLKSHIILTPSVPDRWGAQFHKYPLLTDRFEVQFSLNLKKLSVSPPAQSFAFWYVKENVAAAVPESLAFAGSDVSSHLAQIGFQLSGYRGRFEGVAVVFSSSPQPSIALVTNDGSRDLRLQDLSERRSFDFRKNPRVEVKILFDLNKVVLSVREEVQGRWAEIASVTTKVFSGGYIGLTGVVERGEGKADVVMIDDLKVENLDPKQKGEDHISAPTQPKGMATQQEDEGTLLGDYGEVAEQKAMKILTRNIYRLISETEEPRKATANAVKAMNARLDGIDKVIEDLKAELNTLAGGDLDKQFSKMKDELLQISKQTLVSKEVKQKIEAGGKPGGNRNRDAVTKAVKLKEKLTGSGSFLVVLLGVAFVGIVAMGMMMRRKFGKWEKKHIL